MIIHQPEITIKDGKALLWAKLETSKPRIDFPEYIWFRVPEIYADALSTQSDAFLLTSLYAAMNFKEDIIVKGSVSPKLAYNLDEYQFLINLRKPKFVHPINIHFENLAPIQTQPKVIASALSGGVDSLFTIWKHLAQNQPNSDYQISHGVFVQGFDMFHSETEYYQKQLENFDEQMTKINIEIIPLETNMISIYDQRLPLLYLHGPLIPAVGLALSNMIKRFFIPSSWDYAMGNQRLHTTDPYADAFLSTDTMDIVHHGSVNNRIEKVNQIANWEIAHEILSVCFLDKDINRNYNCGRCEKCMRTMIPLYANGTLEKYKTFEETILKNSDILWFGRHLKAPNFYIQELFHFLKFHKPNAIPWFSLSVILGYIRSLLIKLTPQGIKMWLTRFGMFPDMIATWGAYEIPEITKYIAEQDNN